MPSQVVNELAAFRRGLDAGLVGRTNTMRVSYNVIIRRTQERAEALARQVAAMRAAGQEVPVGRLFRLERYETMLRELARLGTQYSDQIVTPNVEVLQSESAWLAQEHAARLEAVTLGEQQAARFGINFVQVNADAIEAISGTMGDGGFVRNYLRETLPQSTVNAVADALREGIGAGLNPREVGRMAASASGIGLQRATLVARTEMIRAYRESQRTRWESTGVVRAYRRTCAQNERTCLGCIVLDGTVWRMREDIEDHPGGRCGAVPVFLVNGEVIMPPMQGAKEWLAGQDEGVQKHIMGPGRYALWTDKENPVPLTDMATYRPDERFGGAWVPRPLKDIQQTGAGGAADVRATQERTVERIVA